MHERSDEGQPCNIEYQKRYMIKLKCIYGESIIIFMYFKLGTYRFSFDTFPEIMTPILLQVPLLFKDSASINAGTTASSLVAHVNHASPRRRAGYIKKYFRFQG